MPTYLALTIGPIYRTFKPMRRTRSVFAASYLFSWIMREIIQELRKSSASIPDRILFPYANDDSKDDAKEAKLFAPGKGVGVFPDRLLIQADDGDFDKLLAARDQVIKKLVGELNKPELTQDYLAQYLQLYAFEATLGQSDQIVNELNAYLDALELQTRYVAADPDKLVAHLQEIKVGDWPFTDAFPGKSYFPYTSQISTRGLFKDEAALVKFSTEKAKGEVEDEDSFIDWCQEGYPDKFRQYHKYIAIVQADGDNMGMYIEGQKGVTKSLQEASHKLIQFALEATDTIKAYGGTPVYVGGDDLFFFAPVVNYDGKTIFDLLKQVDALFDAKGFAFSGGKATLSYGVSISYYKYPLNEAREEAYKLLMYQAKNKKAHVKKNTIAFKVLKHSGAAFGADVEKSASDAEKSESYADSFYKLLTKNITNENFLTSLIYFVSYFAPLFPGLPRQEDIYQLFDNRMNEAVHDVLKGKGTSTETQEQNLLHTLAEFIHQVYNSYKDRSYPKTSHEREAAALNVILGALRFIQFLKTQAKDDE